IRRESITDVTYLVLLDGRRTTPGHYLGVEYSNDGGRSWSPRNAIRTVDQIVRVNLTYGRIWSLAEVAPGAFQLRLTHLADANTAGQGGPHSPPPAGHRSGPWAPLGGRPPAALS